MQQRAIVCNLRRAENRLSDFERGMERINATWWLYNCVSRVFKGTRCVLYVTFGCNISGCSWCLESMLSLPLGLSSSQPLLPPPPGCPQNIYIDVKMTRAENARAMYSLKAGSVLCLWKQSEESGYYAGETG